MVRSICAALVVIFAAAMAAAAEESLVGTYRMVSFYAEVGGSQSESMGKAPHGYFVFTRTRAITFYTAENRKFGTSATDKAGLLDTLVAWAGTYRIDGDKVIFNVDTSWTENLNGTTTVSTWQRSGNRLTIASSPMPHPRDPSKTMILRSVWEKIE